MEAIIKFLNKKANSYKSSLIRQGPHYAKPVKCVCLVPKGLYGFPKTTGPHYVHYTRNSVKPYSDGTSFLNYV